MLPNFSFNKITQIFSFSKLIFLLFHFSLYGQSDFNNGYYDMHYSSLKGHGWLEGEIGGITSYNVIEDVNLFSKKIKVQNSENLHPNQLIVYHGENSKYYSNVILGIEGNLITMKNNFIVKVKKGENLFNFYNNKSHPNKYGYFSIADNLIENYFIQGELEFETSLPKYYDQIYVKQNNSNNYDNCGSLDSNALDVISSNSKEFIEYTLIKKKQDNYVIKIIANTFGKDVSIVINNGNFYKKTIINTGTPDIVYLEANLKASKHKEVKVRIFSETPNGKFNILKKVQLIKGGKSVIDFKEKKVVLFGDSWFFQDKGGYIRNRLMENISSAIFVNKGIGGDSAKGLLERFERDVTSQTPDLVIFLTGTNDYYLGVSQNVFNERISLLRQKCSSINAKSIFLNNSAGTCNIKETNYNLSRIDATETNWLKRYGQK